MPNVSSQEVKEEGVEGLEYMLKAKAAEEVAETQAKAGQWFCLVTEDKLGNRMSFIEYKQVEAYVEPEPEKPDK